MQGGTVVTVPALGVFVRKYSHASVHASTPVPPGVASDVAAALGDEVGRPTVRRAVLPELGEVEHDGREQHGDGDEQRGDDEHRTPLVAVPAAALPPVEPHPASASKRVTDFPVIPMFWLKMSALMLELRFNITCTRRSLLGRPSLKQGSAENETVPPVSYRRVV